MKNNNYYTVSLKWEGVYATSPEEAAETVLGWISDSPLAFDVLDESSREVEIIDFADLPPEGEGAAMTNLLNGNNADAITQLKKLQRGGFKERLLKELSLIQVHLPDMYGYCLSKLL
jgi:hypothetical protein